MPKWEGGREEEKITKTKIGTRQQDYPIARVTMYRDVRGGEKKERGCSKGTIEETEGENFIRGGLMDRYTANAAKHIHRDSVIKSTTSNNFGSFIGG